MKIIYSGGGTLGSVSPLLAIHSACSKHEGYQGVWIGLNTPREKSFVEGRGLILRSIMSPRFRNFEGQGASLTLLTFPFRFVISFVQVLFLLADEKPSAHVTAGSFVSIPVTLAAWLLGIPNFVHQQDMLPGLANRVMIRLAKTVTVAFPELKEKLGAKTVVIGNPVRPEIFGGNRAEAARIWKLESGLPTILVIGGSSGAEGLNRLIKSALPELVKTAQIIHLTGNITEGAPRYHAVSFIKEDMKHAYAAADLVIARGGLSTLTELGALKKAVVMVPLPETHQEINAKYFDDIGVVQMMAQSTPPAEFAFNVLALLLNELQKQSLKEKLSSIFPAEAAERYAALLKV